MGDDECFRSLKICVHMVGQLEYVLALGLDLGLVAMVMEDMSWPGKEEIAS